MCFTFLLLYRYSRTAKTTTSMSCREEHVTHDAVCLSNWKPNSAFIQPFFTIRARQPWAEAERRTEYTHYKSLRPQLHSAVQGPQQNSSGRRERRRHWSEMDWPSSTQALLTEFVEQQNFSRPHTQLKQILALQWSTSANINFINTKWHQSKYEDMTRRSPLPLD